MIAAKSSQFISPVERRPVEGRDVVIDASVVSLQVEMQKSARLRKEE